MVNLVNFEKTVKELKNFLEIPIANDRDRAGIIKAFEFTFEQAWKSIQKVAAKQGVEIGNPQKAFSYAMQNQWIPVADEAQWLELLKDRNLTTHTYHQDLAMEVLERIQKKYMAMFEVLLSALERE